jgi:hypothetical protein
MARKAFATSFEKTEAENSAGRGGLIFERQSSRPQGKAGVDILYRTIKEARRNADSHTGSSAHRGFSPVITRLAE